MIHEIQQPTPCVTPLGDGWIWYITPAGIKSNDEFTVILTEGGEVRHFTSDQIKIYKNATYGINAVSKESYTEEWARKYNEGTGMGFGPTQVVFSQGWTDELVSEFAGLYEKQHLHSAQAPINIFDAIREFKTKNHIK